jgi:hypothetical protein
MNNTEQQIKELNQRIADLALIVSLKTKEMDAIEKGYAERLLNLNNYVKKIQERIGIDPQDGSIKDTELIDKIRSTNFIDENDPDYIFIPRKSVIMDSSKERPKPSFETVSKPYLLNKDSSSSRRKKISCSYCNEKGHKRAQCPKILYHE